METTMNDFAWISPQPPVPAAEKGANLRLDEIDDLIKRVIAEVRPWTMVPDEGLATTIRLALGAIDAGIPGDLVECGVWKGGCSFAMLLAQRYAFGEIRRPVWMYDSFQGMGAISPQDGEHARWWKQRSLSGAPDPDKQDYCAASLAEVRNNVARLDFNEHVRIVPGWLQATLSNIVPEKIAVLRIDCDWYEPVKCVLEELAPLVSTGGPIILDDYGIWEGCTLATHEYLAKHQLPWAIKSSPNDTGVWMIKTKANW
jgi:O-methyltransferase